jgi:hypothetical protein
LHRWVLASMQEPSPQRKGLDHGHGGVKPFASPRSCSGVDMESNRQHWAHTSKSQRTQRRKYQQEMAMNWGKAIKKRSRRKTGFYRLRTTKWSWAMMWNSTRQTGTSLPSSFTLINTVCILESYFSAAANSAQFINNSSVLNQDWRSERALRINK